jgi:predicted amidohydrolase
MQDLNVTIVQIDQAWEDKQANLNKYQEIFEKLENTDLIVLPEMFNTGFSMNVDQLAEPWSNSTSLSFLQKWSSKLNAAIYTSLIIEENKKCYNRGVFIYPDGKIEFYDKRKSFGLAGEDKLFTAGKNEKIVSLKDWKINLQICYDLRFPELIRNRMEEATNAAYDLLLYVANWPEKRASHWKALLTARAIENQCYVVGVNRIGTDKNQLVYSGDSCIVNSLGINLTPLNPGIESIKTLKLSKNELIETRRMLPFLKDIF